MKDEILKGTFVGLACILLVVGIGSLIGWTLSDYEPSEERLAAEQGVEAAPEVVEEPVEEE